MNNKKEIMLFIFVTFTVSFLNSYYTKNITFDEIKISDITVVFFVSFMFFIISYLINKNK